MAVNLSFIGGAGWQFFDNNGIPLAGGKIYTYAAGTTTPLTTYTARDGLTPNANPIILDSAGRTPAQIWSTEGVLYKYVVATSNDTVLRVWDNIGGSVVASDLGQDLANTTDNAKGDALIGFKQSNASGFIAGATARTVNTKLQEFVSVKDFGAVGDNATDDTAAIQAALNSGSLEVVIPAGGTYIVDGGLTVTTNGQRISAYGATIKLKANATTKWIINSTATDVVFAGGTYDGNKANGNASGSTFGSFGVGLYGDRCTCRDIISINTYGIGIKGFGNYLSAINNRISNTENYGIFFDGSASVSHTGNRAIGNTIDMSSGQVVAGVNVGQGILFTAGTGQAQTAWELADNNIIGPQISVTDQAINLCVRGNSGIVSNNTTRYGAMGFSEGGANTVITGNRFLNLVGSVRYGVEPSGGNTTISNNVITDAISGIIASSSTQNFDGLTISGNNITASGFGVLLQMGVGLTGSNIVISSNYLKAATCVQATRSVKNLTITSNILVGLSPTFASGRGVNLNTVDSDAYVFISGNTIVDVQRPYSVYSAGATAFNYLFATGNNLSLAGSNTNSSAWTAEGSATIGTAVVSANNINPAAIGLEYSVINQGSSIRVQYGTSSPEGSVTAGVGSLFINKSGGAGTTLYIKQTGTGNTGWQGLS